MDFDSMPSRVDVMDWTPRHLADFLRKVKLSGCDKMVLKLNMTGAHFLNMSENDLQQFPTVHTPLISKICHEINKKEERRGLFGKKPTGPKYPEPGLICLSVPDTPEDGGWDEDEFDSDDDYVSPDSDEDSVADYEEPKEVIEEEGGGSDNEYEPPPSEPVAELQHHLLPSLPPSEGTYIDNRNSRCSTRGPPVVAPRPTVGPSVHQSLLVTPSSVPTRRESSPQQPGRPSGKTPAPQIDRSKKPNMLDSGPNPSPIQGRRFGSVTPAGPSWRSQVEHHFSEDPNPTSVQRTKSSRFADVRNEKPAEGSRHHTLPLQSRKAGIPKTSPLGPLAGQTDSLPPNVSTGASLSQKLQAVSRSGSVASAHRKSGPTNQLDSRWYVGRVTRGEAENCLRSLTKDGAYLVRDSTKQLAAQPFTLMVSFQDKVYNIQIRRTPAGLYVLGTGLKSQETFSSVSDIISHYSQSPLLLVDAKCRGSGQHNQCLLSDPAPSHRAAPNQF